MLCVDYSCDTSVATKDELLEFFFYEDKCQAIHRHNAKGLHDIIQKGLHLDIPNRITWNISEYTSNNMELHVNFRYYHWPTVLANNSNLNNKTARLLHTASNLCILANIGWTIYSQFYKSPSRDAAILIEFSDLFPRISLYIPSKQTLLIIGFYFP